MTQIRKFPGSSMKIHAQIVVMTSIAALLGGCPACPLVKPPASTPDAAQPRPEALAAVSPAPAASPSPAPVAPPKEPPLILMAESSMALEGGLLVTGLRVDQDTISIMASGPIRDYKLLTLSEPSRLVIDIPDAVSGFTQKSIPINKLGISTARFESHPGYLRIFLDAAQWRMIPYRIDEAGASLKITITTPWP